MPFVYSTATCSTTYVVYAENMPNAPHSVSLHKILIKGGANIANKHVMTPRGVATEVSDSDLEILMKDQNFLKAMKLGFITVDKGRSEKDIDKKVKDMQSRDGSAPKTKEVLEAETSAKQYDVDSSSVRY